MCNIQQQYDKLLGSYFVIFEICEPLHQFSILRINIEDSSIICSPQNIPHFGIYIEILSSFNSEEKDYPQGYPQFNFHLQTFF